MATREQTAELVKLVKAVQDALKAAQAYADENKLTFAMPLGYHSFSYAGKGTPAGYDWEDSGCSGEGSEGTRSKGEWVSSNDRC